MKKPSVKPSVNFVKIGQAAKILGVSIDTLRRWEKAGKITVQRTEGNTRLYPLNVKIGDASKILGVSIDTLRRWEKAGKIDTIRTEGGTRLYPLVSLSKKDKTPEAIDPLSTEALLKKVNNPDQSISVDQYISGSVDQKVNESETPIHRHTDTLTKFLIGSAGFLILTLILSSVMAGLYFTQPKLARQMVKGTSKLANIFSLPEIEPPPPTTNYELITHNSSVLAETASSPYLEINGDTQINGSLAVRDSILTTDINSLTIEATPSANSFALTSGTTTLTVTNNALLDQDLSTTSSPTFAGINLTGTTLVGKDTTDTLTNKSMSGSSNTFTNIPNSALANGKITITAGTNLTGGGDINLGSSATIALKDSPSLTGTLTVAGATTLSSTLAVTGASTLSSTLAVTGATTLSTLTTTGNVGVGSSLTVTSAAALTTLNVSGISNLAGNVGVGGTAAFNSSLCLNGECKSSWTGIGSYTASNGITLSTVDFQLGGQLSRATGIDLNDQDFGFIGGNVGIGTTNPSTAFSVNENFKVASTGVVTGGAYNGITLAANNDGFAVSGGSTSSRSLTVTGSNITLTGGGNTLTLAGNLSTTTGNITLAANAAGSNVTLPNTGTLATLAGTETLSNKTFSNTTTFSGFVGIGSSLNVSGNVGIGSSLAVSSHTGLNTLGVSGYSSFNSTVALTALSAGTGSGLCLNSSNQLVTCTVGAGGASATGGFVGGVAFFDSGSDLTANPNFFWDSSNNKLGIGTSAPAAAFHNAGGTLFGTLTVADKPTGGNIGTAAATVDLYTSIALNQTTSGQTITLPNPTDTTAGRIVYLSNTGSASFTFLNSAVAANTTTAALWNGSQWTLAGGGGGLTPGTINNSTVRWNSASNQWAENTNFLVDSSGNLTAANGSFSGVVGIGSSLNVSGNVGVGASLTVTSGASFSSSLSVTGNANLSTLNTSGNTGIGGSLTVSSGVNFLSSLKVAGLTSLAGLNATDINASTLTTTGNVGVGSSLTVTSGASFSSSVNVSGNTQLSTLSASGNVGLGASLNVTSGVNLASSLKVTGNSQLSTLTTSGNVGIGSTATITSLTQANGGLTVTGASILQALSATDINSSTLTTTGNVGIGASLTVTSGASFSSSLNVSGNTNLSTLNTSGNVGVGGTATITSLLSANGSAAVTGALCLNGDCKTSWTGVGAYTASNGITLSGTDFQLGGQLTRATGIDINSQNFGFIGGNVGIGTSAPDYNFRVQGSGFFSGFVGIGSSMSVSGNVGVGNSLTVSSAAILDSLSVTKSISGATLGISGASNLAGNVGIGSSLTVTSGASFSSSLSVTGNANLSTLNTSGNTGIGGSLTVSSGVNFLSSLRVAGLTSLAGLNATDINSSTLTTTGNVGVGSSLTVTSGANFSSSVNVSGNTQLSTLSASGNVGLGASLNVTSAGIFGSVGTTSLSVSGASTLSTLTTSGNTGIGGSASITGLTYSLGGLRVNGLSDLTGNVGVGNSLTVSSVAILDSLSVTKSISAATLGVSGASNLAGNVGIGSSLTVTSGVSLSSSLNVNGNTNLSTLNTSGNVGLGASLTVSSHTGLNTLGVSGTSIFSSNISLTGLASGSGNGLCLNAANQIVTCTVGAGGVSGSGFTGGVTFFDSSSSVTANPNFFWNNSTNQLGIGTSAPDYTLRVQGTGYFSGFLGVGSSMNVSGNVGIGSSLVVSSAANINTLNVSGNSQLNTMGVSGNVSLTGLNSGTGNGLCLNASNQIVTCTVGAGGASATGGFVGGVAVFDSTSDLTANPNFFWDNTANRLGIGNSNPDYTLKVTGTSFFSGFVGVGSSMNVTGNVGIGSSLTVSSAANINTLNVSGQSSLNTLGVSGTATLNSTVSLTGLSAGSGNGLCVDSSNKIVTCTVGSGGASATGGFIGGIGFFDSTSDLTASPHLFWDNTNRDLGIGTSAPSYNLQNTGTTYLSGFVGIGSSMSISGNVGIGTSLNVTSATTLDSLSVTKSISGATLGISGASNLAGNVGVGSSLTVTSGANFSSSVNVSGNTQLSTLSASGNVGLGASLNVTSAGIFGSVGTTSLSVSGASTLSTLTTSGNTGIGGSASITGLTYSLGGLRVNGLSDLTGNVGVGNSLTVSSAAILDSLSVTKSISGATLGISGASNLAGNVGIGSTATITSLTQANGGLTVLGASILQTLSATDINSTTLTTTGNVGVGSSLTVTSGANFSSSVNVSGNTQLSTLTTSGNVGLGSSLTVTSGVNFLSSLSIAGLTSLAGLNATDINSSTLTTTGNVGIGSSLTVTSGVSFSSSLNVSGNTNLSTLNTSGNVGLGASLNVTSAGIFGSVGTTSLSVSGASTLSTLTTSGNAGIGGSASITGLTYSLGGLRVNGFSDLTGNVGIGNSLTLTSAGIFNSGLTVAAHTGLATLSTTGNVGLGSSLTVTSGVNFLSSLKVAGLTSLAGLNATDINASTLTTTGNVGIGSSLTVTSGTVLSGGLLVNGGSVVLPSGSVQNSELENSSITVSATAGTGISVSGSPVSLGGTLTVSGIDASTSVKGVASFNSTNFSVSSGAVNTIQDIATTSSPTFVGLSLTSGNLGIGTSSTGAKLQVNGGGLFGWGTAALTGPSNGLGISGNVGIGTTTANSLLSVSGGAHIGSVRQGIAAPTDGLLVDGNVGIGATTSSNKLDVWGNARIAGTLTVDQTATFNGGFSLASGQFLAGNGTASLPSYSFTNSTSTGLWSPSANALSLTTNGSGTSGITIGANGNVGVGTTAPSTMFSVNENFKVTSTGVVTGGAYNGLTLAAAADGFSVAGGSSSSRTLTVTGSNITLTGGGNTLTLGGNLTTQTNNITLTANAAGSSVTLPATGTLATLAGTETLSNKTFSGTIYFADFVGIGSSLNVSGNVGVGQSLTVTSGTVLSGGLLVNGGSVVLPSGSVQNSELENSSITVSATAGTGISVSGSPVSLGGTLTVSGIDASTSVKGVASFNSTNFSVSSGAVNTIQDIATTSSPTFVGLSLTSGNLGIGTSSTGAKLQVNGGGLFGWGTAALTGPSNGLGISGNVGIGTTTANSLLSVSGGAHIGGTYQGITAPTNGLLVDGNVGIGATTSSNKLDVWGNARIAGTAVIDSTLTALNGLFGYSGVTAPASGLAISGNLGIGTTTANNKLQVIGAGTFGANYGAYTAPANGLLIQGNVGIGTSNGTGSYAVDVAGDINITGNFRINGSVMPSGIGGSGVANYLTKFATATTITNATLLWDNGTNLGIGTTSPSQLFQINYSSANPLVFTSGGNLGIGFTTPDRITQISSDIDVTGSLASLLGTNGTQFSITGSTAANLQKKLTLGLDTTDNYGVIQAGNTSGTTYNLALNPAGGNVGIGTTNPGGKLEVVQTSNYAIIATTGSNSNHLTFRNASAPTTDRWAEYLSGNDLRLYDYTATAGDRVTFQAGGNVGINTTTPGYKLDVNGTLNATSVYSNGSLLSPGTGSNWSVTGGDIYRSSGNVGIGTASPGEKLQVAGGGIKVTGALGTNVANAAGLEFNGGARILSWGADASTKGNFIFQAITSDASAYSSQMVITATGNVGIGFTSPTNQLQIYDASSHADMSLKTGSTSSSPYIDFIDPGRTWEMGGNYAGGGNFYLVTGSNGMFMNSSGYVGIGVNSPTSLLDLKEAATNTYISHSNSSASSTSNTIQWGMNANTSTGVRSILNIKSSFNNVTDATRNSLVQFQTANAGTFNTTMTLNGGNVGIGFTSPAANLEVWNNNATGANLNITSVGGTSSPTLNINTGRADYAQIQFNLSGVSKWNIGQYTTGVTGDINDRISIIRGTATEMFTVKSTGNVGIGWTSPTANLEIMQTAGASSNALKLSANGAASWAALNVQQAGASAYGMLVNTASTASSEYIADFRGNGTSRLTVLANGNVGIGTASPNTPLNAYGGTADGLNLVLRVSGGSTNLQSGPAIAFNQRYGGTSFPTWDVGQIGGVYTGEGAGGFGGALTFLTNNGGGAGSVSEKVRITSAGNVGIGTTSPGYTLAVVGSLNVTGAVSCGSGCGAGSSQWSNATGGIYYNGGNVGIGTATPGYPLHMVSTDGAQRYFLLDSHANILSKVNNNALQGMLTLENTNINGADYGDAMLFNLGYGGSTTVAGTTVTGGRIAVASEGDWSSGAASAQDAYMSFANTLDGSLIERMRMTSAGRLGVGNTNPSYELQVSSNNVGGQSTIAVQNTDTSDSTSRARILAITGGTGAGDPFLDLAITGGSEWVVGVDNSDSDKFKISQSGGPGNNDKLTIQTDGNVGIGTASPGALFDVNGNMRVSAGSTLTLMNGAGNGATALYNSGATGVTNLVVRMLSTDLVTFQSDGNVGLGAAPARKFQVYGGDMLVNNVTTGSTSSDGLLIQQSGLNTYIGNQETADLQLFTDNGSNRSYIQFKTGGNIGIGATSPAYKLDVWGTLNATNGIYSNGTLLSPGTGSNWSVSGSDIYRSSGSVAINTSTFYAAAYGPYLQLNIASFDDVYDSNQFVFETQNRASGGGRISFGGVYTGTTNTVWGQISGAKTNATNNDYGGGLALATRPNGGAMTERMRIDEAGNVGIGTSTFSSFTSGIQLQPRARSKYGYLMSDLDGSDASALYLNGNGSGSLYLMDGSGATGILLAPTSDSYITGGNVGIGFTSPTASLHVLNTAAQDSFRVDDVANDTTPFIIDQTGNVGIGFTSPAYKVDVVGTLNASGLKINGVDVATSSDTYWTAAASGIQYTAGDVTVSRNDTSLSGVNLNITNTSTSTRSLSTISVAAGSGLTVTGQMYADYLGTSVLGRAGLAFGTFTNHPIGFMTNNTEKMTLTAVGNLGIGTTTAGNFKLQVAGDIGPNLDNTYNLGSTANRWASLHLGPGSLVVHNDATNTNWSKLDFAGSVAQMITDSSTPIQIVSGTNNLGMYINTSGNVGIGTTGPSTKLHVVGDTVPTGGTGGTITTTVVNGVTYRVHTFTSSGTFVAPSGVGAVEYLVVGGGGGGGGDGNTTGGGGGGGGEVKTGTLTTTSGTSLTVTVGGGGTAGVGTGGNNGGTGSSSVLGSVTATGGGGGSSKQSGVGQNGASGGGGNYGSAGGAGTAVAGYNGGSGSSDESNRAGGGGGGAGATGSNGSGSVGGAGGAGKSSSITGTATCYAGGGGGGTYNGGTTGTATCGGGNGGAAGGQNAGSAGTANTGGGGGGASTTSTGVAGGAGGSGIVVVRYIAPAAIFLGSIGVGTTAPNSMFTVSGNADFSGNVGIGTSTPGELLEVFSGTNTTGTYLKVNENSYGAYLGASTTGHTGAFVGQMKYNFATQLATPDYTYPSGIMFGGRTGTGNISFFSDTNQTRGTAYNPTEVMTIRSTGNVGIGTTAPTLSVSARGLQISSTLENSGPSIIRLSEAGSGYGNFEIRSTRGSGTSGNLLEIGEGSSTFFAIRGDDDGGGTTSRGNVGIGTTAPGAPLHVKAANPNLIIDQTDTSANPGFLINVNGAQRIGMYRQSASNKLSIFSDGRAQSDAASISLEVASNAYGWITPLVIANSGAITMANYGTGACCADIAEFYPSSEPVEAADVMAVDPAGTPGTVKKARAGDTLIGIVSTNPAIAINDQHLVIAGGQDTYQANPTKPVITLAGRVPVKVTEENGAIHAGDHLTVSATQPGFAMKQTQPGQSIGIALENSSGTGKVLTFVNISYVDPSDQLTNLQTQLSNLSFNNGNVGIGTTNPQFTLEINGTGKLNDAGWTYASDRRLKENIGQISGGLEIIEKLNPVTFDYINGGQNRSGFIAQEIQGVLPNLVTTGSDGMLGIRLEELIPYTVKAIQEQQGQLSAISHQLSDIKVSTDGVLEVPEIKAGKITLSADLSINSADVDLLSSLNTISTAILGIQSQEATTSARIDSLQSSVVSLQTIQASQSAALSDLQAQIASLSAQIANQSTATSSASVILASPESTSSATDSGVVASAPPQNDNTLNLTPPDVLLATQSAQLVNLTVTSEATVSGQLTVYNLNVQDGFKALGKTSLGDTTVAGSLTVDGTLAIENGSEINVMGTLYLQKTYLADSLDILNGQFTFTKDGTLTVNGTVLANQFAVKSGTTAGVGTIPAGQTDAILENTYVDEKSIILITPHAPLAQTIAVADRIKGGFRVALAKPEGVDIKFDYMIIGVKE